MAKVAARVGVPFPSLPSISITTADSDTYSDHPLDLVSDYEDNVIPSRASSPTGERTYSRPKQSSQAQHGPARHTGMAIVQTDHHDGTSATDVNGSRTAKTKIQKRVTFPDLPAIVEASPPAKGTDSGQYDAPPRQSLDTLASAGGLEDGEMAGRPSMEEILPVGMDMRGALAKCEDPRLGWSLQFWITIVDPVVCLLPRCRIPTSGCLLRERPC
jgi:hypothetical protein